MWWTTKICDTYTDFDREDSSSSEEHVQSPPNSNNKASITIWKQPIYEASTTGYEDKNRNQCFYNNFTELPHVIACNARKSTFNFDVVCDFSLNMLALGLMGV